MATNRSIAIEVTADSKRAVSAFDALKRSMLDMRGVALTLAGGAFAAMVREQMQLAREIQNVSNALNMQAQSLQQWQLAAQRVGLSSEKIGDIFKDVSDKLGDFATTGGGEAKDVIERLGLSINKLMAMAPDKQLLAIGDALGKVNTQAEKVFLMEALADEASRLIPLLDDNAKKFADITAQLDKMNAVISQSDMQIFAEANEQVTRLDTALNAMGKNISVAVLPPVTALLEKLADIAEDVAGPLTTFFRSMSMAAYRMALEFEHTGKQIGGLMAVLSDPLNDTLRATVSDALDENREEMERLTTDYVAKLEGIGKYADKAAVSNNKFVGTINAKTEATKKVTKELTEEEKARKALEEMEAENLRNATQYISRLIDEQDQLRLTADEYERFNAEKLKLAGVTPEVSAAIDRELFALQALRKEIDAKRAAEDLAREEAERTRQEWERTASLIEDELTGAFMDAFENGGNLAKNLRDAISSLFNQLVLRPVVQAVMSPITNSLTGGLVGGAAQNAIGPTAAGFIGSPFSWAGSALMSGGGATGLFGAGMLNGASALSTGGVGGWMSATGSAFSSGGLAAGIGAAMPVLLPLVATAAVSALMSQPPDPMRGSVQSRIGSGAIGYGDALAFTGSTRFQDDEEQGYEAVGNYASVFGTYNWNMQNGRMSEAEAQGFNEFMRSFGMMEQTIAGLAFKSAEDLNEFTKNLGQIQNGTDEFNQIWRERIRDQMVQRFDEILTAIDGDFSAILEKFDTSSADKFAADLGAMINEFSAARSAVLLTNDVLAEFTAANVNAAQKIISAAGGLESFTAGFAIYADKFLTDQQKFDALSKQVSAFFDDLGLALPGTRDGLAALVRELGAAGDENYGAVISAAGLLDQYYSTLESGSDTTSDAVDQIRKSIESLLSATATLRADIATEINNILGVKPSIDELFNAATTSVGFDITDPDVVNDRLALGAQYIDAVVAQYQEQYAAIQASIDAENQKADALHEAGRVLQDWSKNLLASEQSGLTPGLRLIAAESQYKDLLGLASSGDLDAAQRLSGSAMDYLGVARQQAASSVEYRRIVGRVAGEVGGVGGDLLSYEAQTILFQDELTRIQQEAVDLLSRLDKSAEWLQLQLAEQGKTLTDAIEELTDVLEKLPADIAAAIGDGIGTGEIMEELARLDKAAFDAFHILFGFNDWLKPELARMDRAAYDAFQTIFKNHDWLIGELGRLDRAAYDAFQILFKNHEWLVAELGRLDRAAYDAFQILFKANDWLKGELARLDKAAYDAFHELFGFNGWLKGELNRLDRAAYDAFQILFKANDWLKSELARLDRAAYDAFQITFRNHEKLMAELARLDRAAYDAFQILFRNNADLMLELARMDQAAHDAFGMVFAAQTTAQETLNTIMAAVNALQATLATSMSTIVGAISASTATMTAAVSGIQSAVTSAIASIDIPACPSCECSNTYVTQVIEAAPAGSGFADGGISTGPKSGYTTLLHGTEAVVPLPNGRSIPVDMNISALVSEIKALRADIQAGQVPSIKAAQKTAKILEKWDYDGQPQAREYA